MAVQAPFSSQHIFKAGESQHQRINAGDSNSRFLAQAFPELDEGGRYSGDGAVSAGIPDPQPNNRTDEGILVETTAYQLG
jgi:hypothetical protein